MVSTSHGNLTVDVNDLMDFIYCVDLTDFVRVDLHDLVDCDPGVGPCHGSWLNKKQGKLFERKRR